LQAKEANVGEKNMPVKRVISKAIAVLERVPEFKRGTTFTVGEVSGGKYGDTSGQIIVTGRNGYRRREVTPELLKQMAAHVRLNLGWEIEVGVLPKELREMSEVVVNPVENGLAVFLTDRKTARKARLSAASTRILEAVRNAEVVDAVADGRPRFTLPKSTHAPSSPRIISR
jgi:hypothetical protein